MLQRLKIPLWLPALVGVVAVSLLAKNCRQLTTRLAADERNPLAYVHASQDMFRVEELAADFAAVAAPGDFRIEVYAPEYWPLPWYLRRWNATFFPPAPVDPAAPVNAAIVITDPAGDAAVAARLQGEYRGDLLGLRPNVFLVLRLRQDLLEKSIAQRSQTTHE